MLDSVPPHNTEAEQSILGAILLGDPDALPEILGILRPDHFRKTAHKKIFAAGAALHKAESPVDLITVKEHLAGTGDLDACGGASYLAGLLDFVPASIPYYAEVIIDKWTRRRIIEVGNAMQKIAHRPDPDPLGQCHRLLNGIEPPTGGGDYTTLETGLDTGLSRYEQLYKNQGTLPGVPSGFPDLDALISGFQNSDLIILAARPSMGKTALALNIARNAAVHDHPVGFFSLEMSKPQVIDRQVASESGVNTLKFRRGNFSKEDWIKISEATAKLSEVKLFIDDTPGLSHLDLAARARRMIAREGVKILFVDYLGLMTGDRGQGRVEEVSSISRALKSIARTHDIPVVALSQLNRGLESRDNKRPRLSDLRDSGAIEQDADIVMFLYRDEVYNRKTTEPNIAELEIAKHRTGPTGRIKLRWNRFTTTFNSLQRGVNHAG